MVYTELAPRRQQFHVAPDMQQPNSAISQYTISVDTKHMRYKRIYSLLTFSCKDVRSECAREQSE